MVESTRVGKYLRLPDDYPQGVSTGRDPATAETLNNLWISVPSGSEDRSFMNMRKNQYETQLFRCEDDRVYADSACNILQHTLNLLEKLQTAANEAETRGEP
jgi:paired amphipathic helix protein Sin3a